MCTRLFLLLLTFFSLSSSVARFAEKNPLDVSICREETWKTLLPLLLYHCHDVNFFLGTIRTLCCRAGWRMIINEQMAAVIKRRSNPVHEINETNAGTNWLRLWIHCGGVCFAGRGFFCTKSKGRGSLTFLCKNNPRFLLSKEPNALDCVDEPRTDVIPTCPHNIAVFESVWRWRYYFYFVVDNADGALVYWMNRKFPATTDILTDSLLSFFSSAWFDLAHHSGAWIICLMSWDPFKLLFMYYCNISHWKGRCMLDCLMD